MKKYLTGAVALVALGLVGTSPTLAQAVHHRVYSTAPQRFYDSTTPRQLYMYAPGVPGSSVTPLSPNYTPYPSGDQVTGSQANRSEWDPGYVPGAPNY